MLSVMGIYPIVMNILQFWLIDSIVKASAFLDTFDAIAPSAADREPLVNPDGDSDSEAEEVPRLPGGDLESQSQTESSRGGSRSREASSHSTSSISEPKSVSSSRRRLSRSHAPPSINTHDYPPPRSAERTPPIGSPASSFHPRSLRRRSPPPSPSPSVTPMLYGSTGDSPRLRQPDGVIPWAWEEDKKHASEVVPNGTKPGWSPRMKPLRKESWNLPVVSPPLSPKLT